MEFQTLLFVATAVSLYLFFGARHALTLFIFALMLWPQYLRVEVGPILFSSGRFVALFLILHSIFSRKVRFFNFCGVDRLIIFQLIWGIIAGFLSGGTEGVNRSISIGLDSTMLYFAARLSTRGLDDLAFSAKSSVFLFVVIFSISLFETFTNDSFYRDLIHFRKWDTVFGAVPDEQRLGFYRVRLADSVHIYFGLSLMIFSCIVWSIRNYIGFGLPVKLLAFLGFAAAFTSLSTGPWIAIILYLLLLPSFAFRHKIKYFITLFFPILVFLHFMSDRGLHYVISGLGLNSHTAWYRAKLIDVAVEQISSFWSFGLGPGLVHQWGELIDGRGYTDVVNQYLLIVLNNGLLGLFIFGGIIYGCFSSIVRILKLDRVSGEQKKVFFSLGCCLCAVLVCLMSVNLVGASLSAFYVLLGLIVSVTGSFHEGRDGGRFS